MKVIYMHSHSLEEEEEENSISNSKNFKKHKKVVVYNLNEQIGL